MPRRQVTDDTNELWGEVDAPAVGTTAKVRFDELEPGKSYRVHVLYPSGESAFAKTKANKDGEILTDVEATTEALHVIEVQDPEDDHRVVARAHFTALSE